MRLLIVIIRSLLLVVDSRHYVSTLVLDYSVSASFYVGLFVLRLWMIFVDSFLSFVVDSFRSARHSSVIVHLRVCVYCRYRRRVTVVCRRQLSSSSCRCVNVSFCSRRRLLAVTFDVCCILSTVIVPKNYFFSLDWLDFFGLHRAQVRRDL